MSDKNVINPNETKKITLKNRLAFLASVFNEVDR